MKAAQWFWLVVTIAVIAWYLTITIYVAIRGSFDVKHMLRSLGRKGGNDQAPPPAGG